MKKKLFQSILEFRLKILRDKKIKPFKNFNQNTTKKFLHRHKYI